MPSTQRISLGGFTLCFITRKKKVLFLVRTSGVMESYPNCSRTILLEREMSFKKNLIQKYSRSSEIHRFEVGKVAKNTKIHHFPIVNGSPFTGGQHVTRFLRSVLRQFLVRHSTLAWVMLDLQIVHQPIREHLKVSGKTMRFLFSE